MSSFSAKGNRGVSRISGRKSIHNHDSHCPFRNEGMGRYGLGKGNTQEQGMHSNIQEGTDEVDSNAMSKFVRASTPITSRRSQTRRNSLNSPKHLQPNYTDDSDDDSCLLSKSSPALLSSYSCCREEQERDYRNCSSESPNNSSQNNKSERKTNSVHITPVKIYRDIRRNVEKTNLNIQQSNATANYTNMLCFVPVILIAILSVIVAYNYDLIKIKQEVTNNKSKLHFYNELNNVGIKYNINNNSILQLGAGISTIFERQDTGSFIFVYNSKRRDFNNANFNNFVNDLVTAAARYLRDHIKTIQHVVVESNNLRVHSVKELMDEYITDVDRTGVMLVKDLDGLPSTMAMAFHYYCDEYNPLVKGSAIFFTLNMANCSHVTSEKYTHENIEKCLAGKWEKIPRHNIRPLLTRVVNVVIDVTSDS